MIYTTYFAKLRSLPKNIIPIAICAKSPVGYQGSYYRTLAPKYDFYSKYKENGDESYFTLCYNEQILKNLNPARVITDLYATTGRSYCEGDIALVCYEKATDFCHRHLVAEWLRNNGYQCEEFDFNKNKEILL